MIVYKNKQIILHQGLCENVLKEYPDNHFDSLITDPPAGISFMGKKWDKDKGGRDQWIEWLTSIMKECYRVLKPGAHGLVWSLPRTSHWTATAIENAGFEIRDIVCHLFGTGFPKSADISKQIDLKYCREDLIKKLGRKPTLEELAEAMKNFRKVVGLKHPKYKDGIPGGKGFHDCLGRNGEERIKPEMLTEPATPEAKQWQGFGTALKPAAEHWILCRKPISEKNIASNVLKHDTGGINIDDCRIEMNSKDRQIIENKSSKNPTSNYNDKEYQKYGDYEKNISTKPHIQGRYPANVILSHHPECVLIGTKKIKAIKGGGGIKMPGQNAVYGKFDGKEYSNIITKGDKDGMEEVENWNCHPDCPIRLLDEQSGTTKSSSKNTIRQKGKGITWDTESCRLRNNEVNITGYGDKGGASRFFYCAKASKAERNKGLEEFKQKHVSHDGRNKYIENPYQRHDNIQSNNHPTVKSVALMQYLCRLITPSEGIIIDPFMGSGSTGVAAIKENFNFVGIESEKDYGNISKHRIKYAVDENNKDNINNFFE